MTIIIWFHISGYKTFKDYYTREVYNHLRWAFPFLVSYNRFVELMSDVLIPLCYLRKRAIIETIGDQLKNISQIEHS